MEAILTGTKVKASDVLEYIKNLYPEYVEMFWIDKNPIRNEIHIHKPCFINIAIDEEFAVVKTETELQFKNSIVCVSLWINLRKFHVTVYRK